MQVEQPRFDSCFDEGTVRCVDCPFANEYGRVPRNTLFETLCAGWEFSHDRACPTAETYAEACMEAREVLK